MVCEKPKDRVPPAAFILSTPTQRECYWFEGYKHTGLSKTQVEYLKKFSSEDLFSKEYEIVVGILFILNSLKISLKSACDSMIQYDVKNNIKR